MVKRVAGATDEELEQLAALFRLLSDRTRLNLLMLLADGERNVTSLCEALKLPQPTVSHHLGPGGQPQCCSRRRRPRRRLIPQPRPHRLTELPILLPRAP